MTAVLERAAPRMDPPAPAPSPRRWRAVGWGAVLVGILVDLLLWRAAGPVVHAVVGGLLTVGLPILLLNQKLGQRTPAPERLLYSLGIVVAALLVLGLLMSTLLPLVGVDRPLTRPTLVVVAALGNLGLLLWRHEVVWWRMDTAVLTWAFRPVQAATRPAVLAGVAVALACIGAVRLNNGAGGAVALVGVVLVGLALVDLLLRRDTSVAADCAVVFLAAAALLLGTSLRGWYIIGHDIQREYFVFELAQRAGRWEMSAFPDAYNACLSVNILPTILAAMTGLSGLVVFKVVLQLLFAAMPVATYLYSRRLVGRRLAVVSTVFVLAFPTFFTDMPFLVRQEVAFLFLALVMLAATQPDWSRRRRILATVGFGGAVVLSHYSTTYLVIGTLALAAALRVLALAWARLRRRTGSKETRDPRLATLVGSRHDLVLLSAPVLAGLLAFSWLWTGPATNTGGHLREVVAASVEAVTDPGSVADSSDLSYSIFARGAVPPQRKLDSFADETYAAAREARASGELIATTPAERRPRVLPESVTPLTPLGSALKAVGVDAGEASSFASGLVAKLIQVLILVGACALWLRSPSTRRQTPDVRLLSLATVASLGVLVLTPGLSADYGILRAFQQSLLTLAPVLTLGCLVAFGPLGRRAVVGVAGFAFVVFFLLTGAVAQLFGGHPAQLHLANTGPYHDIYFTTAQEVGTIRWLDDVLESGAVQSEIVTDRFSVRKIAVFRRTYTGTNDEFFPNQLRKDSYVFVGADSVTARRATVFTGGDLIFYAYPMKVLDDHKSLIIDTGTARVYR